MEGEIVTTEIIVALIALAGGIAAEGAKVLFAWIGRKLGKGDALSRIEKKQDKLERDSCRTQLLLLMSDYPDQTEEIMRLAQHYFADLRGNWYMTGLFNHWLEENRIGKPEWFDN